jgi:hypothetical protein
MLAPESRHLLLDALRPPPGYRLSRAVGTSYSLDLEALLLCPLAFAFFESADSEGSPDPVALLAAVRQYAERIDLFCQAGQIAVPREYRRVAAYLEDSVHGVAVAAVPGRPSPIFHPKVWALRFASADGDTRFRVLILSRNLTFDRSWDTVLALDAEPSGEPTPAGQRLAEFVRAMPQLAVNEVGSERRSEIELLSSQIAEAQFELPPPFTDLLFHPLGIDEAPWPFAGRIERLLTVSPFLAPGFLRRVAKSGRDDVLVSRPESLNAIGGAELERFGQLFVLSADANGVEAEEDDRDPPADEALAESAGVSLRGLHAKLFVVDDGWYARVFTGSANATSAAFGGNVEFLAELRGTKSQCGVAATLGGADGQTSLSSLLEPYSVGDAEPMEPSLREQLAKRLDEARRMIAGAAATVAVRACDDGITFDLELDCAAPPVDATASCWPVTLSRGPYRRPFDPPVRWEGVSFEAITPFVAIELELREGDVVESLRFAIRANLVGAPDGRLERLLTLELTSPRSVLRYLILLLASGGTDVSALAGMLTSRETGWVAAEGALIELPLLEAMIRALADGSGRLDAIDRLVADLDRTKEGRLLLPDGFREIWEPIWSVRTAAK